MDMREAFEALPEFVCDPFLLERNRSGEYVYTRIQGMREGFQAGAQHERERVVRDDVARIKAEIDEQLRTYDEPKEFSPELVELADRAIRSRSKDSDKERSGG